MAEISTRPRRCGLDRLVACLRAITLLLAVIAGVLLVLAVRA
ncbi:MAG: hypothetical protein QOD63_1858 [Actinomycetota bacterium]|jgi:hypothetical protein|nr:hypothetical protein [Actinomycetota bacterium]